VTLLSELYPFRNHPCTRGAD